MKKNLAFVVILALFCGSAVAADLTINSLPSANALNGADVLPTMQGGATRQATVAQIQTSVQASIYPQAAAEIASNFTPSGSQWTFEPYDLRRYGAVGDGTTDNTTAINKWISVCQRVKVCYLYPGVYATQGGHLVTSGFSIIGRGGGQWSSGQPQFLLSQNATNLLNINTLTTSGPGTNGMLISGVIFNGGSFAVSDALVAIQGVSMLTIRDAGVHGVVGTGLRVRQVWDSQIDNVMFRGVDAHSTTSGVINIDSRYNSDDNQNVNNLSIRRAHLENNQGTYIFSASDSNLFMLRIDDTKFEVGNGSPTGGPFPLYNLKQATGLININNQYDAFTAGAGYDRIFKLGDTTAATSAVAYQISGNLIHGISTSTYYVDSEAASTGVFDRNIQDDNNLGLVTNTSSRSARFEYPVKGGVQSDVAAVYSRAQDALNGFVGVDRLQNQGPTSFTQNVNSLSVTQDVLVSPASASSILVSLPVPPFTGLTGALRVGVRCFSATGAGTISLQYNTTTLPAVACPTTTFGTITFDVPQAGLSILSGAGSNRFRLATGSSNAEAVTVDGVYFQQIALPYAPIGTGTKFTTSGCSISATVGGPAAGTFTLGANTCTVVVTINGATGLATNERPVTGWACQASDRTAPAVLITNSASTTTTASFSVPAGAGTTDVVSFACSGF